MAKKNKHLAYFNAENLVREILHLPKNETNLTGTERAEILHGDGQNNILVGNAGSDILYGYAGNDWLQGGAGADLLNGGYGKEDRVIYSDSDAAVTINLATNEASGGHAEGDQFAGIEEVEGSQYNDILIGNDQDNVLIGLDGDDHLKAGIGQNILIGGKGADILEGGIPDLSFPVNSPEFDKNIHSFDQVSYLDSSAAVEINLLTNEARGGDAEGDILLNIEEIEGSAYNDILIGNNEGNLFIGGKGADIMDGGENRPVVSENFYIGFKDIVSYHTSSEGVSVNLSTGEVMGGDAEGDQISNFEGVIGSDYDDVLVGTLSSSISESFILGSSLVGGKGNDKLYGSDGEDFLIGGEGRDQLFGGASWDFLLGGRGRDYLEGGAGSDYLEGGNDADKLFGNEDEDYLYGSNGNDELTGGAGADQLRGGEGKDIFIYESLTDSNSSGTDVIEDFIQDKDKIDLSALKSSGIDSFEDLVIDYFSEKDTVVVTTSETAIDSNTGLQADFHLELVGKFEDVLNSDDFIWV